MAVIATVHSGGDGGGGGHCARHGGGNGCGCAMVSVVMWLCYM